MAIKIKKTGSLDLNGIKCCVYGKSGIGKTKLIGTAPKPIVLSCESGLLSLVDEDMPYIEIKTVADIYEAYNFLTKEKKGQRYKTIGLDSVSEIAEVILADYKREDKDPRNSYGKMAEECSDIIRKFRDMKGRNVVFTAKRGRMTDPDSGLTQYVASMPGKILPEGLPYFFDEVFYMDFKEEEEGNLKRVLKTRTSIDHDAKDRSGALKSMEAPNLTKIFKKISKHLKSQEAE